MIDDKDLVGSEFSDGTVTTSVKEMPYLEISDDKLSACIVIPPNPYPVDIKEMLDKHEVTYGIDSELVEKITRDLFDGFKMENRYEVATGKKPVTGQPGELILRTNSPEDMILSSEDLAQVDYKTYKRKLLALCEEEKPIAMVIQPTNGHNGMDVKGNPLEGKDGEEVIYKLGENVYEDGRKIVSKIDGLIEYKKNRDNSIDIDVTEVYIVKEDVDYSTGNIEFPGSVIVKGIIKAGFEVRAKKDVVAETIRGNVYTEGSVLAKQGIIGGTQFASIKAEGSVYAKFVQNARIVSGADINIKKSIVKSEIFAEGTIDVEKGPGSIIGGSLFAVNGINAKILGSDSFVKTEVAIYQSVKDILSMRDIAPKRFTLSKELNKLDTFLGGGNIKNMEYEGDKQELIKKVAAKRESIRRELLLLNNEMKSIQKRLAQPVKGVINVGKSVFPEVRVSVAGKYILIRKERGRGEFRFDEEAGSVEYVQAKSSR